MQDVRPPARQRERDARVEVEAHLPRLGGDADCSHPLDELACAGLALMQHEHAHIPPAIAKQREDREQMCL